MISIDRLTFQVSGLSGDQGRKLAQMVGQDLALVSPPAGCSASLDRMSVDVTPTAGTQLDDLSKLIVADLMRQLERTA
jgi:hypothetical protein